MTKSLSSEALKNFIENFLNDRKAVDMIILPLAGKSVLADYMVIASGTSQRHISMMAEMLVQELKQAGHRGAAIEGLPQSEWVLVDAGDIIVHLFRPETRTYYGLEKMWGIDVPSPDVDHQDVE